MKNKLTDLNNHLFAQLERLSDEDITAEKLEQEIQRADAIIGISEQLVDIANASIKAAALVADYGGSPEKFMPLIAGKIEQAPDHPALAGPRATKQ